VATFAFTIEDGEHGQVFRLLARGELDASNTETLRYQLRRLMKYDGERQVDLRAVDFIDSAALAVLIEAKRADESIRLLGSPAVTQVFDRAGVARLLV
jgi:anti-anti-sigma factor